MNNLYVLYTYFVYIIHTYKLRILECSEPRSLIDIVCLQTAGIGRLSISKEVAYVLAQDNMPQVASVQITYLMALCIVYLKDRTDVIRTLLIDAHKFRPIGCELRNESMDFLLLSNGSGFHATMLALPSQNYRLSLYYHPTLYVSICFFYISSHRCVK